MGSQITLSVGNLDVDWGKNEFFSFHGALFQEGDIGQVPYRYVDIKRKPVTKKKPAYVRPLGSVLPRLELLGYGLNAAKVEFESLRELSRSSVGLDFDGLLAALRKVDLNAVSADYSSDYGFGGFFAEEIYARLNLGEFMKGLRPSRDHLGEVFGNFHPWYVLRLACENPANLKVPVTWCFSDLVENGWAEGEDFQPRLSGQERFLLVTEGSSDAKIIRKAMTLLRPEISDFFYFVDMEEGYPFTGTGNLHRFCQGLASIGILNRVLIIYDNDAEGVSKYEETRSLSLPPNMRVMRLPDLKEFERFPTLGPNGKALENINGRAASIECYLDLDWMKPTRQDAAVRWTLFNEKLQRYHGALIRKELYARRFLGLRQLEPRYDVRKTNAVLGTIIAECVKMASG